LSIRKWILAAVLIALILQLNIYFAWTSHVGAPDFKTQTPVHRAIETEVNFVARTQLSIPGVSPYFEGLAQSSRSIGSSFSGIEMRFFIDYEVVVFTLLIFVISILLFRNKGWAVSILRAFEITSAAILPLGLEIYSFDHAEFNIHASAAQVKVGLGWVTNADVLYISSSILALALVIETIRYVRRRNSAKLVAMPYAAPTVRTSA
jgi:hypothetical protein